MNIFIEKSVFNYSNIIHYTVLVKKFFELFIKLPLIFEKSPNIIAFLINQELVI